MLKTSQHVFILCFLTICLMGLQSVHAVILNTDHFTIDYINDNLNPQSTENPLDLPAGCGAGDYPGHPDYIVKLACWLEHAYSVYDSDGFQVPNANVLVHIVSQNQAGVVTDPHTIWISNSLFMSSLSTLAAHEMFHIVQLQYWDTYPLNYPSIIEGMAEAMQITVIEQSHYIESFFSHPNGHDWDDHDFFEFDEPINDWSEAYDMTVLWLYLMEHNTDNTSPRYPGTDFIIDYLNDMGPTGGPTDPMPVLESLLLSKGTSLDEEMRDFAFANLVRVYDNLDYWQDYGYRWDDSYFNEASGVWSIDGVDELSYGIGSRTLSLTDYGSAGSWMPGYSNSNATNSINIPYGAQYWIIGADQNGLIASEGGLSYDGPGVPYSLDISLSNGVEYLAIAGLHDGSEIFHNTGLRDYTANVTELRLNDDRVVTAAVAVTQNSEVSNYTFEYAINPYSRELDFEETVDIDLDPHQILMLGIDHTGDTLSTIAYWKEPWRGKLLYMGEQEFQMNFRRFDGYWYVNYEGTMIEPGGQDDYTNVYVQSATPGDYRLELRQSPSSTKTGTLMVTLFNYDIDAAALPDLLVRGYDLSMDENGLLEGQIAILNQGTATAVDARVPIFVNSTLAIDPTVTISSGETELINVSYDTGLECPESEEGQEPHWEIIGADVTIYVNSNEGLGGGPMPILQSELTMNNNGPVVVPVGYVCSEGLMAHEIGIFVDDAGRDLAEKHQQFMEFQHQSSKFGLDKTLELIRELEGLLGDLNDLPYPIPVEQWQTYDAFQWFRAVSNWMTDMGMAEEISPLVQSLRNVNNPSGAYYMIPDTLGLDIMEPSVVHTHPRRADPTPDCGLTRMAKDGRNLVIPTVKAAPGQTLSVPIIATDTRAISGADIVITYDRKLLGVVECKTTRLTEDMLLEVNTDVPGRILLAMAGTNALEAGDGPLIDMVFTVSEIAQEGVKLSVALGMSKVYDSQGEMIPMGKYNGKILVAPPCLKGDVNGDGAVSSSDAILVLQIVADIITPTPVQVCAADMDGDRAMTVGDVLLILRRIVGLAPGGKGSLASSEVITVMLGDAVGAAGGTITMPLKVDNIRELAGGDILISYDKAVLRPVGVSSHPSVLLVSNLSESGIIRMAFAGANGLTSRDITQIKFDVIADDISPIIIQKSDFFRSDSRLIDSRQIDGYFRSWATPPEHSLLLQNFPNPFNPETWIPYQLRGGSKVAVRIFSTPGELVRELDLGYKPAGSYLNKDRAAYWDGRNEDGEQVVSGVYFYTISAGEYSATKKMIVTR